MGDNVNTFEVFNPDEACFHSKEWQAGERNADKDIIEGNVVGPFNSIEDALETLKSEEK